MLKKELQQDITVDMSISPQYLVERVLEGADDVKVEDYTVEKGKRDVNAGKEEIIRKSEEDIKCFGGIILTSEDGLIICKNTLDTRIDLAFNVVLPRIRSTLFPEGA